MKDFFLRKFVYGGIGGIKEFQYDQSWDEVKSSPPATVTIETISTCNRTCHYCPQSFKSFVDRKQYKMEEDLFRKIIDDLYDFGFHGTIDTAFVSEPLMDKRFVRLFSYSSRSADPFQIIWEKIPFFIWVNLPVMILSKAVIPLNSAIFWKVLAIP